MSGLIHCQFKHIPSKKDGERLAANIETFVKPKVFDKKGIRESGEDGNSTIQFALKREEVNKVRDLLAQVLPNENSPIWFHIFDKPLDSLLQQTLADPSTVAPHQGATFSATCLFGALQSYNQFYSHVTFNNKVVNVSFKPARPISNTLYIEFDDIRIVIPFLAIQKKNILINKDNGMYVLLPLKYGPSVFRMVTIKDNEKKPVRVCADQPNVDFIKDVAHCSDVVFNIVSPKENTWKFLHYFLFDRPERYHMNFSTFKITDWSRENNKNHRPDPFNYRNASFQDRYALEMLISLGYVFRDKWALFTNDELNWNQWKSEDRYNLCCYAVEQLRADHGFDLRRTEKDYEEKRRKTNVKHPILVQDQERLKVACCTLTPLKLIFQPFEITTGNRTLRNPQFGGVERFLLVHFRDEDNRQLRVSNTSIKIRLKNSMLKGIDLFKKTYKYMGSSTSQMKEMGFWFIDLPSNIKDIQTAYNILGRFDKIKNIATYIARIGQYFSTTWHIGINLTKVKTKNDIPNDSNLYYVYDDPDVKRNGYNFTDGIGKISWGLAGRVAQKMNIPLYSKEDIPSAFQIRVAGCKGMVAIDPDSNLNDYYISVRESMMKFESDDWNLEICEFARPMTLTLNNQVIRLLSDLGNPDDVFISFQNRGLTQWEVPEDQQPTAIDIAVQKNASYSLSRDNLITNRIPIPPTDGRNLFGIADETGELKSGQCFIQYSLLDSTKKTTNQEKFHVLQGTVLVTKNPCLWPGDFRRLQAVRNPRLEKCMRDVIVFPINGSRPHSNEIAGSDLDGDQYWVYWGDDFKIERDVPPLSYEGAKKVEVEKIDQEIIVNHIVESFGAGIILGMIANTHTVVADRHDKHSFGEPCRELADLFSLAVDSPKTGRFVDKKELRPYQAQYCTSWPKFMRKFGEPSYNSSSILEKLFLIAEKKYYEWQERPVVNAFPQEIKPIKGTAVSQSLDEEFKNWLDGKKITKKAAKGSDTPELPDIIPSTVPKKSGKVTLQSSEDKPSLPEPSVKPKIPRNPKPKKPIEENNPIVLINSDPPASTSSSLASSATSIVNDPYQPDFLMGVDVKTSTVSIIQFSPSATNTMCTVHLNKETTNTIDREQVVDKIVSYLEKQDIFKKKSSSYNEMLHGSLSLLVCYGQIYFIEQNPMPQKLGKLQEIIKEKSDQFIRFNNAEIDHLNTRKISISTTIKTKYDYEFNCYLNSNSSEYYTLLFDKNKTLKQICFYRIWSRCYVRQPAFIADCLYEIRSGITYESDSSDFNRIADLILRSKSTGLLDGRKPNIKINRDLLQSSIIPINLKIINEDQQTLIDPSITQSIYRKVKYISIDEQQDKPKLISSMEYRVSPITKDQNILNDICDTALPSIE
ncbi:unnamed protein product [Adineta ricciae]|uniref:RNA-dependent RNA polymerase n=1 Tax=Adineta ricciae TaxID=249248 RepID=A0A815SM37_ADIRI|nr:unnamed protein product [Adineta ricciae]CAF1493720.1 unnamed protein product [Adineta ricciae]